MELVLQREKDKSTAITFLSLEAFCLVTLVVSAIRRKFNFVGLCLASMLAVLAPGAVEYLLHIQIKPGMKKLIMIYAVAGPVGGNVYRLYYTIPIWDKLLHTLCGVIFAAFGYCIPDLLEPDREHTRALRCVCALAVAMGIGAVWEIYEFCGDQLFGLDMQNDRVITEFSSYLLGDSASERGALTEITSVVINGEELGVGGYIDIGIYDTMMDLIVCLVGALGFCVFAKTRKKPLEPQFTRISKESE